LGGKPSTGPKGQAWLQKYGATHNPDGTPKTAAPTAAAPAPAAPAAPAVAKESRTARNDHKFIDELNAMRSIAGIPTKNKW
jgi:hypothetical protein